MLEFNPITEPEAGRVARDAAREIEARGWCQGTGENSDGNVCLMGGYRYAIQKFCKEKDYNYAKISCVGDVEGFMVYAMFRQWLHQMVAPEDPFWVLTHWNDTIGRTKEEVVLYLNKFADEMDPVRE